MAQHTPNNPTRAPAAGQTAPGTPKGPSKPMSPMPAARPTKPGKGAPKGSSGVNPKGQSQTVDGGPKR